jgi:hypothetical protein
MASERTQQKRNARDELAAEARKELKKDFHQLGAKQQSVAATRFYIRNIYNQERSPLPEDELDDAIIDASNDLGCDLIYRDNNLVTIIQTKFRAGGTSEPIDSISHFLSTLVRLRDPEQEPNKHLAEILNEVEWNRDNFELIYLTFGDIKGQALTVSHQQPQYPNIGSNWEQRCQFRFLDSTAINIALRHAAETARNAALDREIKLYPVGQRGQRGAASVVEVKAGDYRSLIMSLDAKQLVNAYKHLSGDAMFSLNIRNYIGNTPINKRIVDSAENDTENFFLYNNGISCLATKIDTAPEHISVQGLQVINGAQTVKSLVNLSGNAERAGKSLWVKDVPKVLVRITEIPEGYGTGGRIRENIIKANNTQNSIRDSDFRSNDPVQENLKKQFSALTRNGKKVVYIPKRTDRTSSNSENVRMEEFAKSVYAFLFSPTDFSGASAFLFKDESPDDGYQRVFGDADKMPDDEFRFRAGIYWIAQEISSRIRDYREKLEDPDARAALERKWLGSRLIKPTRR